MKKYRHILWDVDGTIVDTYQANVSSLIEILSKYMPDHNCTEQDYAAIFGIPEKDGLKMLHAPEDKIDLMVSQWVDLVRTKSHLFSLYDGVLEVMTSLKDQGFEQYLITSRTRGVCQGGPLGNWVPDPVAHLVGGAICANDVKRPKPAPDSILLYMEQKHATKDEILFIGDTHTDYLCAKESGVDFALALWGFVEGHVAQDELDCQYHFNHPHQVLSLLTS